MAILEFGLCVYIPGMSIFVFVHLILRTAAWRCLSSIVRAVQFVFSTPSSWDLLASWLSAACEERDLYQKRVRHFSLSPASASMDTIHLLSTLLLAIRSFALIWTSADPSGLFISFLRHLLGPLLSMGPCTLKSRGKQCSAGNLAHKCTSLDTLLNALTTDTVNLLWHRVGPSFCAAE